MILIYNRNLPNPVSSKKIDNFLAELQKTYSDKISNPRHYWNPDHTHMFFSVGIMGTDTHGKIHLEKDKITFELEIPFLLSLFSKTIKEMIAKQFDSLLSTSPQQKHL